MKRNGSPRSGSGGGAPEAERSIDINIDIDGDKHPRRIGRYEIEAVLGSGSMGVVFRATDTVLGRPVAIKTIREELVAGERAYKAYRRRFYREARIFGSLSHPNIVKLYDIGETDQRIPYLAMEFVRGTSLGDPEKRLTLDQSMWVLSQLASGIDYAHGMNVLHRDIKPSNILISDGDEAKLADFGIAKLLGTEFTRSQTLFGTPGFMSPEQVVGKKLTGKTDIFSLGAVAFELLSGETPFPGNSVHSVLHKIVHADPVVPTCLDHLGLSRERWSEVFRKALAKDPKDRYETASALVSDLVEVSPGSWLGGLLDVGIDTTAGPAGPGPTASTSVEPAAEKIPERSESQNDRNTLTLGPSYLEFSQASPRDTGRSREDSK